MINLFKKEKLTQIKRSNKLPENFIKVGNKKEAYEKALNDLKSFKHSLGKINEFINPNTKEVVGYKAISYLQIYENDKPVESLNIYLF